MIPRLDYQDSLSPTTLQFLELLARSAFRGDIEKSYASRLAMATDNSVYQVVPQAVLYPRSADDIAVMLKLAQGPEYATLSFFPRGGGTGTNGQSLGGGIIVDLSRHMNQILEINLEEGWVRAQAEPTAAGPGSANALRLLLSLREGTRPLQQAAAGAEPVWFLSGPEGGLSAAEEALAVQHGFAPTTLGPRVLRAETAPLAALAALTLV